MFLIYFAVAAAILIALPVSGPVICLLISLVWSFNFNAYHIRKLIERGYVLADTAEINRQAAMTVDMSPAEMGARFMSPDLTTDAYRLFLVKKYKIEKNDALGKMVVGERLFDTIDEALKYADGLEFADSAPLSPSPMPR